MKKNYFILIFFLLSMISFAQIQLPKLQYVHPKDNSTHINTNASIVFGFNQPLTNEQITSLSVEVKTSNNIIYPIQIVSARQNKTLVIKPLESFMPGEKIFVTLKSENILSEFESFSFSVSENTWNEKIKEQISELKNSILKSTSIKTTNSLNADENIINGVAVPSDFPTFRPSIDGITAPGYLFLSNWTGTPYIMILKNDGTPIYYQKVEGLSIDFKVQPNGLLTRHIRNDFSAYVSMDQLYNIVDTFMCQNGYETDEHDIILFENGNALIIGKESRLMDISQVVEGGRTDATVVGNHIQEIDKNNNVVFEFNCWDNFDISGAAEIDLTGFTIDYVHMNSIAIDYDSNILVSSRHLSECTKINRQTGEIIWRLGGKFNQFEFINEDIMIDYQHDFNPVPGSPGNYTIYDNGNHRGYTRIVEYKINTDSMTATKVWEYRHNPDRIVNTMGNAQRLSNGNTLINWSEAGLPKATEVNQNGEVVYEGDFTVNSACYRTFRFEWDGFSPQPYLLVESFPGKIKLIFNKFGDNNIAEYNIYGGTSPTSEDFITSTSNSWIDLTDLENQKTYYFKVTSVDNEGNESGFSNQDSIYVQLPIPGVNLIRNGDFLEGTDHWSFYLFGDADAEGIVNQDSQFVFDIINGGSMEVGVQFRQNNIPLIYGNTYKFEFDAFTDNPRSIVAKVGMDQMPYTNYSNIGTTNLKTENNRYSYEFVMLDSTDLNSRVVFNCGNNNNNVTIDNVSLFIKEKEEEEEVPNQINILSSGSVKTITFPNPVLDVLTIQYEIVNAGIVRLKIYDLTGKELYCKEPEYIDKGIGTIELDIKKYLPGIYICSFEFIQDNSTNKFVVHNKIVKSGQ
ncbi:aryl-sulfate sulfotransferase [Bacteroidota bacterium]